MKLVLVRHGHPSDGPDGLHDPGLSPHGQAQARAVAEVLASMGSQGSFELLATSPLRRAVDTAAPIAHATGLQPKVLEGLAEADRHAGRYRSVEALRQSPEWEVFLRDPIRYLGADPQRFREAVLGALETVLASGARHAVLVTHGIPINLMLSHVLGLERVTHFVPHYGSISTLAGDTIDRLQVVSVNETQHLPRKAPA